MSYTRPNRRAPLSYVCLAMIRMVDTVAVRRGHTNGSWYCSFSIPSVPMTGIWALAMYLLLMAWVRPSDDGTTGRAK